MRKVVAAALGALVLVAALSPAVPGQQLGKLTPADPDFEKMFGLSVAVFEDTAFVGAPYTGLWDKKPPGSVYVFEREGDVWAQRAKLAAADGVIDDKFGWSIAVSGDTLLVGAPHIPSYEPGAAYVFTRTGGIWTQQAKLTAGDGQDGHGFGKSVALSGDTALVGDEGHNAAYVFHRSGGAWSQQTKLAGVHPNDVFGHAVALEGETAVVTARDAPWPQGQGLAYVFARSGVTWTLEAVLRGDDGTAYLDFGDAVAISGDTLAATARGKAFVFVRNGEQWLQQAKLVTFDPLGNDALGSSVALVGDSAIVGAAYGDPSDGSSAYVFTRRGGIWAQESILRAADGIPYDYFGWSVALSNSIALVGGIGPPEDYEGAAYLFTPDCREEGLVSSKVDALEDEIATIDPSLAEQVDNLNCSLLVPLSL